VLERRGRVLFGFRLDRGKGDKIFHVHRRGEGRILGFLGVLAGITGWGGRRTLSGGSAAFGRGRSPQTCCVWTGRSADTLGCGSWGGQELVLASLIFVVRIVSASSHRRSRGRGGIIDEALVRAFDGGADEIGTVRGGRAWLLATSGIRGSSLTLAAGEMALVSRSGRGLVLGP